ncbi:MAG: beta-lactamase-like protein [Monoraphidium minutum]|nr:MAG: beta-lactamase-like protein [Monoraphidium minutum]
MLGLPAVLSARPAAGPPLLVVGPSEAREWLAALAPHHAGWCYEFLPLPRFSGGWGPQAHPQAQPRAWGAAAGGGRGGGGAAVMGARLGFSAWASVAVDHCHGAFGLVLQHSQGWKLVYSGDTRPCDRLVAAGAGATLLIHEATFEPALQDHARRKRHSTSAEAVQVGAAMGAYRTLLTHFSQRYPKLPAGLDAAAPRWRERPLLGFDGMVLPLALLPQVPALTPLVAAALGEAEGEGGGGADGGA